LVIVALAAKLVWSGGAARAEQAFLINPTVQILQNYLHCTLETIPARLFTYLRRFRRRAIPVNIRVTSTRFAGSLKRFERKRFEVADTTKIEDKKERKELKRAARKKAAPKAKQTEPRGSKKKKVKKLARGVSKR
jgi:hypothetical protein